MLANFIFLMVGLIVLILLEHNNLAKTPYSWQEVKSLLVIYTIPCVGIFFAEVFDPAYGMLVAVLWMLCLFIFPAVSRLNIRKVYKIALNILLFLVFLLAIFNVSPLYRCPVEGKWFILGKNATLIEQLDGTITLCHRSSPDVYRSDCHDFVGGYHGILATPIN